MIRLKDDELGIISPTEFIPVAEQNGEILKIGKFIFEEACRFIKKGSAVELGLEFVHVNLSIVQCMQSGLVDQFVNIMDKYKVCPSQICLEINETSAVQTPHIIQQNLMRLSEIGIKLGLDNYGVGSSNIKYLLNLPYKFIKIEKEIVWVALENEKARIAIECTVAMMQKLNMKIIAEGVESLEQLEKMSDIRCDFIQGYYFSEPVDEKTFLDFLSNSQSFKELYK